MRRLRNLFVFGLLSAVALAAQEPHAESTSRKLSCASCHKDEAENQPRTPMGMALELPPDQSTLKKHPLLTYEKNGFSYRIERKGDQSTYTVSDGKDSVTLPLDDAFGVGMQTYVLKHDGKYYESLVSYYPMLGGLAITMGDEQLTPHSIVEAIGRQLGAEEIKACFGCHTSGVSGEGNSNPDSFTPGLTCERCHAGSQAHSDSLLHGKTVVMPKHLVGMGAEDTSSFCGACHRTFDTVVKLRAFGQLNVRFQPYRLAKSRCFNGADPRIGCTACHNPHHDLATEPASYDVKCLACHSGHATKTVAYHQAPNADAKMCPVAKSNCVSCHMPKVELPGSHTQFTDHMIRIVMPGEAYPE